ncbi:hypothetical protein LOD99_42 [Oopsacas minuta]|uniref:SCP domain-containing protein n=1 Tax=Oopsacas minuta TaxID=111878 RepID=A0AAV7K9I1_9METZ|nr:hypothetical protein LOD99_42 [Oopsacas minuta]
MINNARRTTDPIGANIRAVKWSDCYVKIALEHLQQCGDVDALNSDRQTQAADTGCEASDSVGETIYNPPIGDTTGPVGFWAREGDFYNLLKILAQFDQMNCGRTGETFLCNYGLANGLYIKDAQCSGCDDEFPCGNKGLCSQTAVTDPSTATVTTKSQRHNHQRGHRVHDHNHGDKKHDHAHDRGRRVRNIGAYKYGRQNTHN